MSIIKHSSITLNQLLESLEYCAGRSERVDRAGISWWGNHELVPDADFVEPGTQLSACLEYGRHHGTLGALHAIPEPLAGTVFVINNYSGAEAKARIVNLTRLKFYLYPGSALLQATAQEFEISFWTNGRAYSEEIAKALGSCIGTIFQNA